MREIPKEIINDVLKITNELLVYKNEKKLSWIKAYKDVLKKLNIEENDTILTNVVTQITRLGYDIEDNPFSLTKYN